MSFLTTRYSKPFGPAYTRCLNCGHSWMLHSVGEMNCPDQINLNQLEKEMAQVYAETGREPTMKRRRKIPNELLRDDWDPAWELYVHNMNVLNKAFTASTEKLCATPYPLAGSGSEPATKTATESSETSTVAPSTRTSGSTVSASDKYLMASMFITGVSTTVALILAALVYFLAANTVVIISSSGEKTSPPAAREGTHSRPRMLF